MLNPVRAYRAYRWRKRVEWFHDAAEKARAWRDSPWNMKQHFKRNPTELIRKELTGHILIGESSYAYGGDIRGPSVRDGDTIFLRLSEGVHWMPPDDLTPAEMRAFFETSFPATLHPNECVLDRTTRCVRDDHHHGDQ
jgi:hypothetical protein